VVIGLIGLVAGLIAIARRMRRRRRESDRTIPAIRDPPDADRVLDGD
jgi:hypothetical protein